MAAPAGVFLYHAPLGACRRRRSCEQSVNAAPKSHANMTTKPSNSSAAVDAPESSGGGLARRWILAIGLVVGLMGVLGAVMLTSPNRRPNLKVSIEGGEKEPPNGSREEHPLVPALEFARKVEAN